MDDKLLKYLLNGVTGEILLLDDDHEITLKSQSYLPLRWNTLATAPNAEKYILTVYRKLKKPTQKVLDNVISKVGNSVLRRGYLLISTPKVEEVEKKNGWYSNKIIWKTIPTSNLKTVSTHERVEIEKINKPYSLQPQKVEVKQLSLF